MSKPKFPTVPTGPDWIRRINPSWFQDLRAFCEYAVEHPRGDGQTILNTGDGILRANVRPISGSGGGVTFPCFYVSVNDKSKLDVTGGWLNRNGEMVRVDEQKGIDPKTGYLCIYTEPDENGSWSVPELKITAPAPEAYPVAEIKVESGSVSVIQYPVAVAVILLVKRCPVAEF